MTEKEILKAIDEIPTDRLEAKIVAAKLSGLKSGVCEGGGWIMEWYRKNEDIVPTKLKKI